MNLLRSISFLALASSAVASHAVLTVYTDRAAFEAATTGGISVTETFDVDRDLALGDNLYNGVNYRQDGKFDYENVKIEGGEFLGAELNTFIVANHAYGFASQAFVFGPGTFAFGADFLGAFTSLDGLGFEIAGQTLRLKNYLAKPGTGFFGVVSSVAFTTVDLRSGGDPPTYSEIYSLDNLTRVSFAPSVPGPLAALPFALMALRRRKKA